MLSCKLNQKKKSLFSFFLFRGGCIDWESMRPSTLYAEGTTDTFAPSVVLSPSLMTFSPRRFRMLWR